MTTINLSSSTTGPDEARSLFIGSEPFESNGELAFDLRGGGDVVCSNVGRQQAEAIIAALQAAFPEPVRPEPFTSAGMAGTRVRVSRDWNESFDHALPYVTLSLDKDSLARPVLASLPLSEAQRLGDWLDANSSETE